jgi:CHAT domain-containing protein/tetratricopeptide (TPR) repeat protein
MHNRSWYRPVFYTAMACLLCAGMFVSCTGKKKKEAGHTGSAVSSTRSSQDFTALASAFLSRAEPDSALRYYGFALKAAAGRQQWKQQAGILIKIADIHRSGGSIDSALLNVEQAAVIQAERLENDKNLLADIRHKQGVLYMDKGQFDLAVQFLRESIAVRSAVNGTADTLLAMTYNGLGNLSFFRGDYSEALANYTRAYELALQRKNPQDADLAMFIQNIGIIRAQTGDYEKAEEAFSQMLEIYEKILNPGDPALAMPYLNMGRFMILAYKDDEALSYYNQAEDILLKRGGPDHPDLAGVYLNKGQIYVHMADYEKALIFFNKVLALASGKFEPGHPMILSANMNIGYIYEKKSDFANALRYYRASIPEKTVNPSAIKTYSNLASLYNSMNEPDTAASYYNKAIQLAVELLDADHPETALLFTRYGYFQLSEGRDDLGFSMFRRALSISKSNFGPHSREVSNNLTHLGNYYLITGNAAAALTHYRDAISALIPNYASAEPLENPESKDLIPDRYLVNALNGKADALYTLWESKSELKLLESCLEAYTLSVKVVDKLRLSYQNEESKLLLSADERNTYLNTVRVATILYRISGDQKYLELAFNYADKGKSTVLLASIQDVEARQFGKIPPAIRALERNLRLDLGSFNRLMYEERQKSSPDDGKIKFWESRVFDLEARYDSLIKVLEKDYPDYYALKYTSPSPDIARIRENLEPGRALVEYTLTDSLLYTFVINREKFDVLTSRIPTDFTASIRALTAATTSGGMMSPEMKDYLSYVKAARSLYSVLLEPVKRLVDDKKLIIVPDAEIGYISFDMLLDAPSDTTRMDFRNLPFLIRSHVISYSASATLQFSDLIRNHGRAERNLLAMAPAYDNLTDLENDAFIDETGNAVYLLPIPGVEEEIRKISRGPGADKYYGVQATEQAFKKRASKYNILHFAMHTLINNEEPMLSKLVFYQDGDTVEDGMLNTYELFGMELNASLAVLSACNTGTGRLLKGEGIMNLARGFLYAGVPGIVMTMWSVDDQASARIVNNFYKYIRKGMHRDEALRQAKLDMLAEGDMLRSHPYYWAAYVTIGDYSPVTFVRPRWLDLIFGITGVSALILLIVGAVSGKGKSRTRVGGSAVSSK